MLLLDNTRNKLSSRTPLAGGLTAETGRLFICINLHIYVGPWLYILSPVRTSFSWAKTECAQRPVDEHFFLIVNTTLYNSTESNEATSSSVQATPFPFSKVQKALSLLKDDNRYKTNSVDRTHAKPGAWERDFLLLKNNNKNEQNKTKTERKRCRLSRLLTFSTLVSLLPSPSYKGHVSV